MAKTAGWLMRHWTEPHEPRPPMPPRGVVAEVHYTREDGLPTYAVGVLTTEHPSSSQGLPVWVAQTQYREDDPLVRGQAYGPIDLPAFYTMVVYCLPPCD